MAQRNTKEPTSNEPTDKELTYKQRVFALEYVTCWNGTEAARRAKYRGNDATLASIAYENLRKPQIRAFIDAQLKEKVMSADEVLGRLSDQAAATGDDFLTIHESPLTDITGQPVLNSDGLPIVRFFPALDLQKMHARGKLHLIKEVTYTAHGPSVKLHDAQAALALLGKYHKLFTDRHEISGLDGGAIEVKAIDYRAGITALAPGPISDRDPSGEDESSCDGSAMG